MRDEHKNRLALFRDGTIYGSKYDEELEEFKYVYLAPKNVLYHLWEPVAIEDGFTLRDYFNLVINYYPLRMIDYFMDCFIDEFKECPEEGCLSEEFDYLTISRVTSYTGAMTVKLGPNDEGKIEEIPFDEMVEDRIHFDGVCKDLINDNDKNWGIELEDLNFLLDHQIIIDKHHVVIDEGNNNTNNLFENMIIRSGPIEDLSLYEFITTIIFELSFFGCAEDRRKMEEEIFNREGGHKDE